MGVLKAGRKKGEYNGPEKKKKSGIDLVRTCISVEAESQESVAEIISGLRAHNGERTTLGELCRIGLRLLFERSTPEIAMLVRQEKDRRVKD